MPEPLDLSKSVYNVNQLMTYHSTFLLNEHEIIQTGSMEIARGLEKRMKNMQEEMNTQMEQWIGLNGPGQYGKIFMPWTIRREEHEHRWVYTLNGFVVPTRNIKDLIAKTWHIYLREA